MYLIEATLSLSVDRLFAKHFVFQYVLTSAVPCASNVSILGSLIFCMQGVCVAFRCILSVCCSSEVFWLSESVTVFHAGSHTRGNIANFLTGGWPAMGRISVQCLRQISTKRHATPVSGFHSSLLPGKTKKKLYFLSLFTFLLFLMCEKSLDTQGCFDCCGFLIIKRD